MNSCCGVYRCSLGSVASNCLWSLANDTCVALIRMSRTSCFRCCIFFFQAEYGIRDLVPSRGLGDVYKRQIQNHLRTNGIAPVQVVDESTRGPGHLMLEDPDGNPILIDQHV